MRYFNLPSYSSHKNADCRTDCFNQNFDSQQITPNSASTYSFRSCSWDGCLREPGGAISSTTSGASITVTTCTFNNCNSTKQNTQPSYSYTGGAICAKGIKELTVSSSFFIHCCAPQKKNDNGGSGGIFASDIQTTISVSSSDFICCFTGSSGAGLQLGAIQSSDVGPQTINNCRFMYCTAEGNTPDGGALNFLKSSYTPGCSNCLLSYCKAKFGGGIHFVFNSNPHPHPFHCCFFNRNSVPSGGSGNDICFSNKPSLPPLVHCFSTTSSSKIYNGDDNWLPQGSISFGNSTTERKQDSTYEKTKHQINK